MKILSEEAGIVLEEVFNGIGLRSPDGEVLGIAMRDGGFEINYGGVWFRAVGGSIEPMGSWMKKEMKAHMESMGIGKKEKEDHYKWREMTYTGKEGVMLNDVCIVNLPVSVIFKHSDKIVAQVDEFDNPVEFTSGFIMEVIPDQQFVYNGQNTRYMYSTMPGDGTD